MGQVYISRPRVTLPQPPLIEPPLYIKRVMGPSPLSSHTGLLVCELWGTCLFFSLLFLYYGLSFSPLLSAFIPPLSSSFYFCNYNYFYYNFLHFSISTVFNTFVTCMGRLPCRSLETTVKSTQLWQA